MERDPRPSGWPIVAAALGVVAGSLLPWRLTYAGPIADPNRIVDHGGDRWWVATLLLGAWIASAAAAARRWGWTAALQGVVGLAFLTAACLGVWRWRAIAGSGVPPFPGLQLLIPAAVVGTLLALGALAERAARRGASRRRGAGDAA